MKKILELIAEQFGPAFAACGYDMGYAKITLSNRPDLCEYQCNGAMAAAKAYKKKPIDIATEVTEKVKECPMFSEVNAVMPGFINLKLSGIPGGLYKRDGCRCEAGLRSRGDPETIIVDYGGANVAKPLHVGHLRSAVIGESVKRLGRFLGHMIGDVHLGDWGLQMGLIIEELRDRKPELVYFDPDYEGAYPEEAPFTFQRAGGDLSGGQRQVQGGRRVPGEGPAGDPEASERLRAVTGPSGSTLCIVSLADLKKNYHSLNVDFDLWKGESDAQPYIPGLIQDLIDKGLAYESQGALVVDIAEETDAKELPPCIVRKSDGAALYATSDLATIIEREKEYHPDRYIYVVDKRQELHFTQVFRVAKKAGIVAQEKPMQFLGFGTMNGKDGKPFKTREGGVMRLENLIAGISDAVYDRIVENREVGEEEARQTAEIVGLAALNYGDLSNQASKDYIFDVDRFTSFTGNTGPYILYTIVRIKSILAKYAAKEERLPDGQPIRGAEGGSEKALELALTKFNETIDAAFAELAPHKICQYIYELSDMFNQFYRDNIILGETDKEKQASWISLITLTRQVLETCIQILGFEAPDWM